MKWRLHALIELDMELDDTPPGDEFVRAALVRSLHGIGPAAVVFVQSAEVGSRPHRLS